MESARSDILGSKISILDLHETCEYLANNARVWKPGAESRYICVSNVHTVVTGATNAEYRRITNESALATPDGVPLVWASKLLRGPSIHGRASGPDILAKLLADPHYGDLKHFFYGSTPEVIENLKIKIAGKFPKAKIVGFLSPPLRRAFRADEPLTVDELEEISQINDAQPHFVWVGLGAPKQELWMYRVRAALRVPYSLGVGAAFDFIAETKARAPLWMQQAGLEWFFRLSQEPTRLLGRYLSTNPVFVASVLRQAAKERLRIGS